MKKLLALLLLCPALAFAAGGVATLTWTPPTAYNDGTVLTPSEIAFYTISYNRGNTLVTVTVNAPASTTTVNVICGSTNFIISVTTTATANYPNATSGSSAQVPYATNVQCVPNTPANFKAVSTVAPAPFTATYTWDAVTAYTTGQPLASTPTYKLYSVNPTTGAAGFISYMGNVATWKITYNTPGKYCRAITAQVYNPNASESVRTPPVCVQVS